MMRLPSPWERFAMERNVLRCCRDSIVGWIQRHPDGPVEGTRDFCNHCGSDFVWTRGAWEIDEPTTFAKLRQDYARTTDAQPAATGYKRLNDAQNVTPPVTRLQSFVIRFEGEPNAPLGFLEQRPVDGTWTKDACSWSYATPLDQDAATILHAKLTALGYAVVIRNDPNQRVGVHLYHPEGVRFELPTPKPLVTP